MVKYNKWPVNLVKIEKEDLDLFEENYTILQMQVESDAVEWEDKAREMRAQENPDEFKKDGRFLYVGACRDMDEKRHLRYYLFDKKEVPSTKIEEFLENNSSLKEIMPDDVPEYVLLRLFLNSLKAENRSGLNDPIFALYKDEKDEDDEKAYIGVKVQSYSTPEYGSDYVILWPQASKIRPYLEAMDEWKAKKQMLLLKEEEKGELSEKEETELKRLNRKLRETPIWFGKKINPMRMLALGESIEDAYVHSQDRDDGKATCRYFTFTVSSLKKIECKSILLDWCVEQVNKKYGEYLSVKYVEADCDVIRKNSSSDYSKRMEERIQKELPEVDLYDTTNDPEGVEKLLSVFEKKFPYVKVRVVSKIDDAVPTLVIVPPKYSDDDGHEDKKIHRKHIIIRCRQSAEDIEKDRPGKLLRPDTIKIKIQQSLSGLINNRAAESCDLGLMFTKPKKLKEYVGWTFLMYDKIKNVYKANVYGLKVLEDGRIQYLPKYQAEYPRKEVISYECILPDGEKYRVNQTMLRPMPRTDEMREIIDAFRRAQTYEYRVGDLYTIFHDGGVADKDNIFFGKDPDLTCQFSQFAKKIGKKPKVRKGLNDFYAAEGITPGIAPTFKKQELTDACSADLYDVCIWSEDIKGMYEKQWYISSGVASKGQQDNQGTANAPVLYRISRSDGQEVEREILVKLAELMDSKFIRTTGDPVKPAPFKMLQIAKRYDLIPKE